MYREGFLFPRTKLRPPELRDDLIPRPELAARLSQSLSSLRLTLLSSPAGYGKTSALAALLERQANPPIAWLRLDDSDDDPTRFFAALVGAVGNLYPQIGGTSTALLGTLSDPGAESGRLAGVSINELLEADPEPFVLVLDDFHLISAPNTLHILGSILSHCPPQMRLAITTRQDPPLPLSRMRGRGQLAEYRLPELRFSLPETRAFLNDQLGLNLPDDTLKMVHSRLEGWPAGMRLLANSLRSTPDARQQQALMDKLSGTDRYLSDFLKEEVLERQAPEIRAFLLETCVLDELTPSLCRIVTRREEAARLLDEIWRRNLFLIQMDAEGEAFRYHAIFLEFLRQRLRVRMPGKRAELHGRAAAGLRRADPAAAIGHLLVAGRWQAAMTLIEGVAEGFLERGRVDTVQGWLQAIPPGNSRQRPKLNMIKGLCAYRKNEMNEAEKRFEAALEGITGREAGGWMGKALAHLAGVVWTQTDLEKSDDLIRRALAHPLPAVEALRLYLIGAALGLYQGDEARAQEDITNAFDLAEDADREDVYRLFLGWMTPGVVCFPGNLDRAERICQQVQEITEEAVTPLSMANNVAMTLVHLYRGRLKRARHRVQAALGLESRLGGGPSLVWKSILYSALAMIHRGRRRYRAAARAVEVALQEYGSLVPERALISLRYQKGYILWLRGRTNDLRQLYQRLQGGKLVGRGMNAPGRVLKGLLELRADRYGRAVRELSEAVRIGEELQMYYPFGSPRLQLAHAYWKWGRTEKALAEFTPLLRQCKQDRMAGRILMEGDPALPLLERCADEGIEPEFARVLLRKLAADREASAVQIPATGETLTPRQVEVLDLLAAGATNKEIAADLFISVHTVKRHVSAILARMNVSTRTEAAARARELGIL